ncbi:hypothetical protein Indivirus_4_42 [Indivirus ILV1]|uniref:Minor capsid protein P8 central region domain-containing protein n=1 Tax=Indivirus ILV1 TaxID=1977633 RepID=A0A1V0SDR4_9VIRU|nr:hypothetical protein Indivirus_4_42 [Indivirus ILV1]
MNYQNFAGYSNKPPMYGRESDAYYDKGSGVPQMNANNMTIQDIYRTPFLLLQSHHSNFGDMADVALKGIQSNSDLSKLFFSDDNMKRLQRNIKKEVYKRTNGKFTLDIDQDQSDLFIVMRAVYMENARFLENGIIRQVKRLNEKVINEVVPGILVNIKQYHGYLKEINKPLDPIPLPLNTNNAGRKTLQSITTTFF